MTTTTPHPQQRTAHSRPIRQAVQQAVQQTTEPKEEIVQKQKERQEMVDRVRNAVGESRHSLSNTLASFKPSRMSINRTLSVVVWMAGAYLTVQALLQIHVPELWATPIGLSLQLIFTRLESPIFRGHGLPKVPLFILFIDVFINTTGAWPYTKHIGEYDGWTMIKDIMRNPNLEPNVYTQLGLAIGLGFGTAWAAEFLWNLPD